MKRVTLTGPVSIKGLDILGRKSTLKIIPVENPGIFWQLKEGSKIWIGDAHLGAHRLFHHLTLGWKKNLLRVPEHLLGCLYSLGLDGVCLIPENSLLPHNGRAKIFLDGLQSGLKENGEFEHWTPRKTIHIEQGAGRFLEFSPNKSATLEYEIHIDYSGVGQLTLSGSLEEIDLVELLSSRPYGRTIFHKSLSRMVGRMEDSVWFEPNDNKKQIEEKLREIALHRLLDLLGAFVCACPYDRRLAGKITSRLVGHVADIEFVHTLREMGSCLPRLETKGSPGQFTRIIDGV